MVAELGLKARASIYNLGAARALFPADEKNEK
jgi:hypothetical protein